MRGRRNFRSNNEHPRERRSFNANDNPTEEGDKNDFRHNKSYKSHRKEGWKNYDDSNESEHKFRPKREFDHKNERFHHEKVNSDDNSDNDNFYRNKYSRRKFNDEKRYDDNDFKRSQTQSKAKFNQRKKRDDDDDDIEDFNFQRNKKERNNKNDDQFTTKVELNKYADSDFFISLIHAYISDNDDYFESINGNLFSISSDDDKAILSYSPLSDESIELMNRAIYCAETLMPFTPKTVIYHNDYPNCAIEVTVNGSTKYETKIHLINKTNKNLPKAFNLNNKKIIEFMCEKVQELSSSMNLYRIALTAEALSFSLDDNHQDVRYEHISISNCPTVFGKVFDDKNRLIVLISNGEKMPPKQKELDWMMQNFSQEEELIQAAASLAKGLVRAYHAHDLFVIKESPEFRYSGPANAFSTLTQGRNSKIKDICNVLFRDYTRGTLLSKNIDIQNLAFVEPGYTSITDIESKLDQLFTEKKKLNIDFLKKRKDHLFQQVETAKRNKKPVSTSIGNELSDTKNKINRFYEINKQIDVLKNKKSKILDDKINKQTLIHEIEKNGFKGRLLQMFGCNVFSSEEPTQNDQDEKIEKALLKIERDLKINAFCVEKLVSATIVVSHRSTSPLSPDQFEDTIERVCSKFSFIVPFCSDYIPQQNSFRSNSGQIGIIFIEVIDPQFSIVVVSEIKQALLGEQFNIFRIPENIASKKMLQDKKNEEIVRNWIKENQLKSIKFNGENWFGSKEDVDKAYSLLSKSDTSIKFPEKVIQIPPFISKSQIKKNCS